MVLIKFIYREVVNDAVLELISSFLNSLYSAALYYAALRVFSEQYAMLASAGIVLSYFIVHARSSGTSTDAWIFRPEHVLAELPVPPVAVFRLAWFVSSAISCAATLVNFYILQLVLGHLRVVPPCLPTVPLLAALASPAVSLFMELQSAIQRYVFSVLSFRIFSLISKKIEISYTFVRNIVSRISFLLISFLYSATPIYYTYASMPWWAKPLALVNPQTFLIEAGRGGMDPAAAAAAIALSLCAYYAANEKLFERFVEARRSGRSTM